MTALTFIILAMLRVNVEVQSYEFCHEGRKAEELDWNSVRVPAVT